MGPNNKAKIFARDPGQAKSSVFSAGRPWGKGCEILGRDQEDRQTGRMDLGAVWGDRTWRAVSHEAHRTEREGHAFFYRQASSFPVGRLREGIRAALGRDQRGVVDARCSYFTPSFQGLALSPHPGK